jgi:3-oxoacyl-[acyl-carrier-protein] synthase-3
MASAIARLGIEGFGFAFGEDQDVAKVAGDYVADPERVIRWGYHTFHRAADGVTATALASEAARNALNSLSMSADDVDLVVLAASELAEYPYWDASAALARELKVHNKQTLWLTEGCASGVTGLGMVAGLFTLQPELNTALFVAVNRVSEFHRNRMNVNNAVHSDGAVAAVIRRDHPRNQWLATDQFTDPELCDWFRTDYGGAVEPVPPPGWSSANAPAGHVRVQEHFGKDPKRLMEFVDLLNARVVEVIERACRRADVSRDEVKHVIYINDAPDAIDDVARPFGVPPERTNAPLAVGHGHMGAADQLTAYGQQLEQGVIVPGDLVALAGISIGMRWYSTLIRA